MVLTALYRPWRLLLGSGLTMAFLALLTGLAWSQDGQVIYTHRGANKPNELRFQKGNDSYGVAENADLTELSSGTKLCWVVRDANPLLYNYSATSETLAVSSPAELKDLIKLLGSVITKEAGAADTKGGMPVGGGTDSTRYLAAVRMCITELAAMEDIRWASDTSSFGASSCSLAEQAHQSRRPDRRGEGEP